jgi:hypothetical protein
MMQARDLPKIVLAAYHFVPYLFDAQEGEVTELLLSPPVNQQLAHLLIYTNILFWIPFRL